MKYGRLTIVSEAYRKFPTETSTQKSTYVKAVCDCGNKKDYELRSLQNGSTQSCGCFAKEVLSKRRRSHGLTTIRKGVDFDIYNVWAGMKRRCYDKGQPCYAQYGGRGIMVCREWVTNPAAFHKWAMQNGYKKGLFIDRKDNDKGYSPFNCRFITQRESTRNRRVVKLCVDKAERIRKLYSLGDSTMLEIAVKFGVSQSQIERVIKFKQWVS